MNSYFVYILKCSDKSYYTGITNDVERRLIEHKSGIDESSYTYKRRPLDLVFRQEFNDIKQAILFEKQIKGWSRKKKEAIINGECNTLPDLSKNRMK